MSTQALLSDIETFLAETEMPPSTFGRRAVNDWKFVRDLRAGKRRVWPETAEKVRRFMESARSAPTEAAA